MTLVTPFSRASTSALNIAGVIDRSVRITRRHWARLSILTVVCIIGPADLINALAIPLGRSALAAARGLSDPGSRFVAILGGGWGVMLALFIAYLVVGLFYEAAVVEVTLSDGEGEAPPPLSGAWRHVPALCGVGIVVTIANSLAGVVLIVPGLVLATALSVAGQACVAERRGVFGALNRSRELTRGSRWKIFLTLLMLLVAYYVIIWAIGILRLILVVPALWWTLTVDAVIQGALAVILNVGMTVLFTALRSAKEGETGSRLAAAFA